MGLQILPADIPPPGRVNDIPAPRRAAGGASSRFDGYLSDARSAVGTDPAAQPPEAPRPDADPSTDIDEIDADAAPPADDVETTVHEPTIVTAPPVAIATDVPVVTPNAAELQAESSSTAQQQPAGITPGPSAETTEQGFSRPALADSPGQSGTLPQEVKASGQHTEPSVNQNIRSAPTSENAEQNGRTATKTLSDQPQPVRELVDGPYQQTQKVTDQNRAPEQTLAPIQSRARQEAVDANQPSPLEPPNPRLAATQQGALDSRPQNPTKETTQRAPDPAAPVRLRAPRPVAIKAGKGDGAAAAFAKFLITSANQAGPGSAGNAAAPTSVGIGQAVSQTASAPGANQAPVANLVADLLAARVDDAAAIKGAARVLNASGRSGKFEVTMQLDPPELGQLKLQIQMREQGMTLRVNAQTQAVAKLIESRLTELSDALALHGIRVDRAEVTVRSAGSTQADTQSPQDNGPSNRGDFNQASSQGRGDGDQGEAASYQTAEEYVNDPKQSGEDLDGEPYRDDLTAPAGLGAETNDANTPATELSVNLVA